MSWNYRMTRTDTGDGEYVYAVREVYYYDDNVSIRGWTDRPVSLIGESPEDIESDLRFIWGVFQKPVIDVTDDAHPYEVKS